ncbi:hypothetical protein KM043_000446 [Ampulex compressa]|nr:hypothetical protein KM043_000446 [Ampulex compressa]
MARAWPSISRYAERRTSFRQSGSDQLTRVKKRGRHGVRIELFSILGPPAAMQIGEPLANRRRTGGFARIASPARPEKGELHSPPRGIARPARRDGGPRGPSSVDEAAGRRR